MTRTEELTRALTAWLRFQNTAELRGKPKYLEIVTRLSRLGFVIHAGDKLIRPFTAKQMQHFDRVKLGEFGYNRRISQLQWKGDHHAARIRNQKMTSADECRAMKTGDYKIAITAMALWLKYVFGVTTQTEITVRPHYSNGMPVEWHEEKLVKPRFGGNPVRGDLLVASMTYNPKTYVFMKPDGKPMIIAYDSGLGQALTAVATMQAMGMKEPTIEEFAAISRAAEPPLPLFAD